MSQAPLMPVFTDALIGDTTFLSAEEFGAYCLILFATWRNNGQAFADDDRFLARICRVSERRWRERIRPIIVRFFEISDGSWRQKRLEKEWKIATFRAEKSRSNGVQGGRPKSLNSRETENPTGLFQVTIEGTQTVTSQTQTHTHTDSPPNGGRQNAPSRRAIADSMIEIWKLELGGMLRSPSKLTATRITLANSRFADEFDHDLERWRGFCRALRDKPFLVGDNDRQWRCDFDWCLKPSNTIKIIEGKYDKQLTNGRLDDSGLHDGPTEPPPEIEGFKFPMARAH